MSKSRRVDRQAIDIAHNIVLAQIIVPKLQAKHCDQIRSQICQILGKAVDSAIMEAQAAQLFDSLAKEAQLLVLATALSSLTGPCFTEFELLEWSYIENPLVQKISTQDIHRARKLYFRWQGLAAAPCTALQYLHQNWLTGFPSAEYPVYKGSDMPKTGSSSTLALGHA